MSVHLPEITGLEQIKLKRPTISNANIVSQQELGVLDRLAVRITDRVGTMGFFLTIVIWSVLWLGWNILAPKSLQFDPPMAFVLWLFISNLIQICLMPLIMVGQNIQGRHAEVRAEQDFLVNQKAELEIEDVLMHLEFQTKVLARLDNQLASIGNAALRESGDSPTGQP